MELLGRIVRYRLCEGPRKGESRPMIVTHQGNPDEEGREVVNGLVFMDGANDGDYLPLPTAPLLWKSAVRRGTEAGEWDLF